MFIDINECIEESTCAKEETCLNTYGSYHCLETSCNDLEWDQSLR